MATTGAHEGAARRKIAVAQKIEMANVKAGKRWLSALLSGWIVDAEATTDH